MIRLPLLKLDNPHIYTLIYILRDKTCSGKGAPAGDFLQQEVKPFVIEVDTRIKSMDKRLPSREQGFNHDLGVLSSSNFMSENCNLLIEQ